MIRIALSMPVAGAISGEIVPGKISAMSSVTVELNQRLYTIANLRKMNKNSKVGNRIASTGFMGALLVGKVSFCGAAFHNGVNKHLYLYHSSNQFLSP